jgi:hypothetical protein
MLSCGKWQIVRRWCDLEELQGNQATVFGLGRVRIDASKNQSTGPTDDPTRLVVCDKVGGIIVVVGFLLLSSSLLRIDFTRNHGIQQLCSTKDGPKYTTKYQRMSTPSYRMLEYSCNACGSACGVGSSVDKKRGSVMLLLFVVVSFFLFLFHISFVIVIITVGTFSLLPKTVLYILWKRAVHSRVSSDTDNDTGERRTFVWRIQNVKGDSTCLFLNVCASI